VETCDFAALEAMRESRMLKPAITLSSDSVVARAGDAGAAEATGLAAAVGWRALTACGATLCALSCGSATHFNVLAGLSGLAGGTSGRPILTSFVEASSCAGCMPALFPA